MKKFRRTSWFNGKSKQQASKVEEEMHFQQANITRAIIWPYSNRYYDNAFSTIFMAVKNFSFQAIFLVELICLSDIL